MGLGGHSAVTVSVGMPLAPDVPFISVGAIVSLSSNGYFYGGPWVGFTSGGPSASVTADDVPGGGPSTYPAQTSALFGGPLPDQLVVLASDKRKAYRRRLALASGRPVFLRGCFHR